MEYDKSGSCWTGSGDYQLWVKGGGGEGGAGKGGGGA